MPACRRLPKPRPLNPWTATPEKLLEEHLRPGSLSRWKGNRLRIMRNRLMASDLITVEGTLTAKGKALRKNLKVAALVVARAKAAPVCPAVQPWHKDAVKHSHVRILGPDKPRHCRIGRVYPVIRWSDRTGGEATLPFFRGERGQQVQGRYQGGSPISHYPFWEPCTPPPKRRPKGKFLECDDEIRIAEQFDAWWKHAPVTRGYSENLARNAAQCGWREVVHRLSAALPERKELAQRMFRAWYGTPKASLGRENPDYAARWHAAADYVLAMIKGPKKESPK